MNHHNPARVYRHLYFLYAWIEPCENPARLSLRYRLEDAATHEQHLFGQLSKLIEFLQAQENRLSEDRNRSSQEEK